MKKRISALVLACAMCLTLCATAFAGSTSKSGSCTGVTGAKLITSATLDVNKDRGYATTSSTFVPDVIYHTTVNFYYFDSASHLVSTSGSGDTSASAGIISSKGQSATSEHTVDGGQTWGFWRCSLEANA